MAAGAVLDDTFVDLVGEAEGDVVLVIDEDDIEAVRSAVPPLAATLSGFRSMGSRPGELARAVRQGQADVAAGRRVDPAVFLETISATLATAAAEIEVQAVEDAGEMAMRAFSRIADGHRRSLFAAGTLAAFSRALGRDVSTHDWIPTIDRRASAHLIVRKGHGTFKVADPFVQQAWMQQERRRRTLGAEDSALTLPSDTARWWRGATLRAQVVSPPSEADREAHRAARR